MHDRNESDLIVTARPPRGHPIYSESNLNREIAEWFADYLVAAGQDRSRSWAMPVLEVTVRGCRYYVMPDDVVFEERGGGYRLVALGFYGEEKRDLPRPVLVEILRKIDAGLAAARTAFNTPDQFWVE
jgi:hypothetical protein